MDNIIPEQPDFSLLLPRDAYYTLVHTLRSSLPPLDTDSPEDIVRRDNAAIAKVASLLPATAAEAELAAQFVAASAQAQEVLRLAREYPMDAALGLKCNAQAASMMRESRGALGMLLRLKAERKKLEADGTAADKAAWLEHCSIALMAEALPDRPPMAAMNPPAPATPEPAADEEPVHDPIAEAEHYAIIYPERAKLIRRNRGLPDKVSFGPPDDDVVRGLVTGQTPILLALDRT